MNNGPDGSHLNDGMDAVATDLSVANKPKNGTTPPQATNAIQKDTLENLRIQLELLKRARGR